ncbi:MAG TPA: flagellar FliJ family protein [Pyrinomonadaceae bacterium]
MSKNKYPLCSVLSARDEQKREAASLVESRREQLASAEAELALRVQAVEDCRSEQATAQDRMLEQMTAGGTAQAMLTHHDYVSWLKETERELLARVEQQRPVVARASGELERATAALLEAAREHKVVEKHQEKWHVARAREAERAEQKQLDEIATILFARRASG